MSSGSFGSGTLNFERFVASVREPLRVLLKGFKDLNLSCAKFEPDLTWLQIWEAFYPHLQSSFWHPNNQPNLGVLAICLTPPKSYKEFNTHQRAECNLRGKDITVAV